MNIGLNYTSVITVENSNTALALGSGDMEVFATPAMVALMENAAMNAVAAHLEAGQTTVGSQITTTHIKPSALGATITATATLTAVEGRKLSFAVEAHDGETLIGSGTHIRYIVDRERFLAKLPR
ncbi:MAG: thioesterase family protein [Alistipes sp.]|nr:thioesterase family protein [Alistipes sp.]